MSNSIKETRFNLPNQTKFYKGKVRDVYTIGSDQLVMVVSDRISAFDVVLPEGIPYKGQVLSQIASKFLDATSDIVPNWKQATPDPNVTVGKMCDPFKVEMVIRGYLTGHAWREYRDGKRMLCGVPMPDGIYKPFLNRYSEIGNFSFLFIILFFFKTGCKCIGQKKGLVSIPYFLRIFAKLFAEILFFNSKPYTQ